MKTSVAVNVMSDDMTAARAAVQSAFHHMAATAALLTRFDADSPVARLNRDGHLADPPPILRTVLDQALATSRATDGDFDITVLPVLGYYLAQQRPLTLSAADRQAIDVRDKLVSYSNVHLDDHAVRLLRPAMAITLDGIAKGCVVDQGITALREAGIEYALIDAGGEIRAMVGANRGRFWNVGIVDPSDTKRIAAVVQLRNAALSTSGNYEVFFSRDRRLFHIINPHTGYSPDRYSSVSVMANHSMEADAMSVAAFSMALPRLKESMAKTGHQWLVFSWNGAKRWRSPDLPLVSGAAEVL